MTNEQKIIAGFLLRLMLIVFLTYILYQEICYEH